jgi:adenylosuccinate synthase
LLGLGFGDCGKGLFTDALCRRWPVPAIVRFNGGAQAGHNVVLPDGRHHTFSQFGSGSFVPGVVTVLAEPVIVHPSALQIEAGRLVAAGVGDARQRLLIDARCRVNTPFHQAAGRLREWRRGAAAHGTCGVGVGETVRQALACPENVLRYGDLRRPARAMQQLEAIRRNLRTEGVGEVPPASAGQAAAEYRVLDDAGLSERWLTAIQPLLRDVPPLPSERIAERLSRAGTVLFEGAQGMLLDEGYGFHPHTTWSSLHPGAVERVAAAYGLSGRIEHLGILRAYLTRHGLGPLPTADVALADLPEPHNSGEGWQGTFRRGHPDGVLLTYALAASGPLDGLLVSHLDVFERDVTLRWCESYRVAPATMQARLCRVAIADPGRVIGLNLPPEKDLAHQAALTQLLFSARPEYDPEHLKSPAALLERLEALAACRVRLTSRGPTHEAVSGRVG